MRQYGIAKPLESSFVDVSWTSKSCVDAIKCGLKNKSYWQMLTPNTYGCLQEELWRKHQCVRCLIVFFYLKHLKSVNWNLFCFCKVLLETEKHSFRLRIDSFLKCRPIITNTVGRSIIVTEGCDDFKGSHGFINKVQGERDMPILHETISAIMLHIKRWQPPCKIHTRYVSNKFLTLTCDRRYQFLSFIKTLLLLLLLLLLLFCCF